MPLALILLAVSPFLPLIFFTDDANAIDLQIYFLPYKIYASALAIPFLLGLVYMVFGSDFFLFRWLDNALVILIEYYISNI